jgi:PTS system nitrogen regulatory IIA component
MSREDFDMASLSRYLHLAPDQVTKLIERGNLPGRRIGGQWRFSREEVHHWLEERLGAGGDEELAHVETILDASQGKQHDITIASLLEVEAIAVPLNARTKNSVITSMVDLAAQTGLLWDIEKMTEAVRARENLHSTALGIGVALLHPRRPLPQILGETFLALGVTSAGIPFGDERGRLTDIFFLICSIDDATHLRVLARLSRLVMDGDFLAALRSAGTPPEAYEQIEAAERRVFGSL